MIHLLPLPGDPKGVGDFELAMTRALNDAQTLMSSGVSSAIIENFGDAPFWSECVPPHVSAMMAVIGHAIHQQTGLNLGVNVLRNDAKSALGVAAAIGAEFIRINVHTGSVWSDQGLIVGKAPQTLMYRRMLGSQTRVFADIKVKHAVPAGTTDVVQLAKEATLRGGADGLIVTGAETGGACDLEEVRALGMVTKKIGVPLWIGSGITPDNLDEFLPYIEGAIVGTYFHKDGDIEKPLCGARIQELLESIS